MKCMTGVGSNPETLTQIYCLLVRTEVQFGRETYRGASARVFKIKSKHYREI